MRYSPNSWGAMLMAISMFSFVFNDGLMKVLFADMSIYQAIFLRGLVTAPLMALLALRAGLLIARLGRRDTRLVLIRVASELAATVGFLTALSYMPLANVTAILQVLPLTVTMAAALFLGEAVGWRRWLAILFGFGGVLLIIRPGMDGFSAYSIWALGAVAAVTIREITTRKLSRDVPSLPVALATAVSICGLGAISLPGVTWTPVEPVMWLYICGAGVSIIGGYLFSVMAVRNGELGFVSPFRYTAMVWAIALGYLLFDEWPDLPTLTGTAIIIATGLYSLHRERFRALEAANRRPSA